MTTPEDVAREFVCEVSWNAAEDWTCLAHETFWTEEDQWCPVAVRLIREYADEVGKGAADLLAHVDHLTAENTRLREGIAALVSVGYSHTPDCEADDYQRVAYGGHPDCGLCWEDNLAALLNPPTEGENDEPA